MTDLPVYQNILLTTDFSELSVRAVPHAIAIARKFKSKIYVLHVLEPILSPVEYSWGSVQIDSMEISRQESTGKSLLTWCENHIPENIDTRLLIRKGIAVSEIISVIDEYKIDLVCMATHGHTGISHVIFGSTTERILEKSAVPVISVR